jgi:hypothetical protein
MDTFKYVDEISNAFDNFLDDLSQRGIKIEYGFFFEINNKEIRKASVLFMSNMKKNKVPYILHGVAREMSDENSENTIN